MDWGLPGRDALGRVSDSVTDPFFGLPACLAQSLFGSHLLTRGRQFCLDNLFERGFRFGTTQPDSVDEKSWSSGNPCAHHFLNVFLDLRLIFAPSQARIKLSFIELQTASLLDQSLPIEFVGASEKKVMVSQNLPCSPAQREDSAAN